MALNKTRTRYIKVVFNVVIIQSEVLVFFNKTARTDKILSKANSTLVLVLIG